MNRSTSAPSPLSPTLWPPSAFRWWRSLLFAAAWIGIYLAGAIAVAVGLRLAGIAPQNAVANAWFVVGSQFALYVPLALLLVFGLPALARRSLAELGLRPVHRLALWGFGGAAAMYGVTAVIGVVEERGLHITIHETAVSILKDAHGPAALAFGLLAVVVAPFIEELTFRGFVFNALLRYLPPLVAGALAAALFGLAHYDPQSSSAVIPLAAGGAVLCWVYYRSGSLLATMIAHGTFNLVSVLGVLLLHQT